MFKKNLLLALTSACLLVSCAKSPTGRSQFKLFPAGQMNAMGKQAFDGMKEEGNPTKVVKTNAYVNCVAKHITAQVPKSVFAGEWEVVVFEDNQVNAFALPGGKIGVYTGLLNVADNAHQLAAVMGHEVGHVIADHGNERMSSGTVMNVGMQVTNKLLNTNQISHSKEIMSAIGLGLQVGVQLPFSRTHESEADVIGLDLMAKAGFKPEESVSLWQNMAKASSGQRPMELLSTHPAPQTRISHLQQNMPRARSLYQAAAVKPNCPKPVIPKVKEDKAKEKKKNKANA